MKTVRKHLTVGMLGGYIVVGLLGIIGMIITISDAFTAISVLKNAGRDPNEPYWITLYVVPSIIGILYLGFAIAGAIFYIRADMFSDTPKRENRVLHIGIFTTCILVLTRLIQWFYYANNGLAGLLGPIFHMTFFLPLAAIVVLIVRRYFDGKHAIVSRILAGVVHLLCAISLLVALIGGTSNVCETLFYVLLLVLSCGGIAYHMLISPWKKYIQ